MVDRRQKLLRCGLISLKVIAKAQHAVILNKGEQKQNAKTIEDSTEWAGC